MGIVTQEELRDDKGWVRTARLRWMDNGTGRELQQRWVRSSNGQIEWRAIEVVVKESAE